MLSSRVRLLPLTAAVAIAASCGWHWETVESREGQFRVVMPPPTRVVESEGSSELGTFRWRGHVSEQRGSIWNRFQDDGPVVGVKSFDLDSIAPEARSSIVDAVLMPDAAPGTRVSTRAFEGKACSGKEIDLEAKDFYARRRVCATGGRVYLLEYFGYSREEVEGKQAQQFFDSFEVTSSEG